MEMDKAQGALEYLVIVAAVLGIAAVIVAVISGMFASQKRRASLSECKSAASQCAEEMVTATNPPCNYCEDACKGVDVAGNTSAVDICKAGNTTQIISGGG